MAERQKSNLATAKKGPFTTKMKYPGPEAYTFPHGAAQLSPCMSPFWRNKPLRQGKKRSDTEHDEKPEEPEEEYDDN